MKAGDLVWVYESQSGRPIIQELPDGESRTIRHHLGRGGVVSLAEVTVPPQEDPGAETERYVNGTKIWWRWRATTRIINSAGFIPRKVLNGLLGYKPRNPLRGFGTRSSGLMEISLAVHLQIRSAFLASHQATDGLLLQQGRTSRRGGVGGEGAIHKSLKKAIAENPSCVLGEDGLELIQVEYPFVVTGDRIDVLLRDGLGRYMAVEVEPECPADHTAGPLQCMKYRALLAYQLDRDVDEIRTALVTHLLSENVRGKAEKYGVECFEIRPSP
jgi:hypothetical protein